MKTQARLAKARQLAAEKADGRVVRGRDLPPAYRSLLIREGMLPAIIKGWYFFVDPESPADLATLWREEFWHFLHLHLASRGGYCLGPENSIDLRSGHAEPPEHVTALLESGGNNTVRLRLANTGTACSLLTYKAHHPNDIPTIAGMRVMPVGYALARVSPRYYAARRDRIEILLRTTPASELANGILEADIEAGAERILGALEATGLDEQAREVRVLIIDTGWKRAVNPFPVDLQVPPLPALPVTPRMNIQRFWQNMRGAILETFPQSQTPLSPEDWLDRAQKLSVMDAYHALTMEGYDLFPRHVERIAVGEKPLDIKENARLAVKGYLAAHAAVLKSARQVFVSGARGATLVNDMCVWNAEFRRPFGNKLPGAEADELHGRFQSQDARALIIALEAEPYAAVRAILGHYLCLQIEPFPGNNHVMARFFLNAVLSTDRYPWTVLRVARTKEYLAALEQAFNDILPLAIFLREEMNNTWE